MNFVIATPVFKGMPALRRCIGSVRGQILPQAEPPVDGCQMMVDKDMAGGHANDGCRLSVVGDSQRTYQQINPSASTICVQHIVQDGGSSDGSREFLEKLCGMPVDGCQMMVDKESLTTHPSREGMLHKEQLSNYQLSFASEADKGMYDAINKAWERGLGAPINREQSIVNRAGSLNNESPASVATDNLHPQIESARLGSITNNRQDTIVSWLNSDEQYLPGTLQKVAVYFESHPEIDVVWGEFICVNKDGSPAALRRDIPVRRFYMQNCRCYVASCTAFYRRSLWDKGVLRLDDSYRFSADRELYLRLIKSGAKFLHVPEYFSLFELADQNLSVKHYDAMYKEYQKISQLYGGGGRAVQLAAKILRGAERVFRGCYVPKDIEFNYVLDEFGRTQSRRGQRVSHRMDYSGG